MLPLILLIPCLTNCNSKSYTIKFVNYDDSLLEEINNVKENTIPTYSKSIPTKPEIIGATYTFAGWDKKIYPANKDEIYKATFNKKNNYNVKFINCNGEVLEEYSKVNEGDTVYYSKEVSPIHPERSKEKENYLIFNGWDSKIEKITANKIYKATYSLATNNSDKDEDGVIDLIDPLPIENKFNCSLECDEQLCDKEEFNLDFKNFVDYDNKIYHPNLMKLAIMIHYNLYHDSKLKINNIDYDYDETLSLYNLLNFKNITPFNTNVSSVDINDNLYGILANKEFIYKNQNYNIVFVNLDTSDRKGRTNWSSNFDIGADIDEYYNYYGNEHPDWPVEDRNIHKGFAVTKNRVKPFIDDYLNNFNKENTIIYLTGYSRGATIANLLAGEYEENNYKIFNYNIAPSLVLFNNEIKEYKTIYNLINKDDICTQICFKYLDSKRYGKNIEFSCSKYSQYFKKLVNVNYEYISNIEGTLEKIKPMCPDRNSCYKINYDNSNFIGINKSYSTNEIAQENYNKYIKLLNDIGIPNNYYDLQLNGKKIIGYNCLNCLLIFAAKYIQGEIKSIDEGLLDLFDNYRSLAISLYLKGISMEAVQYPHYLNSYLTIIDNNLN